LEYVKEDKLPDELLEFETYDPLRAKCFSVGVLYSREGQVDESEMFNNEKASPAFLQFLRFLGDEIPLQGWKGYRGDLDVKTNTSGTHTVFRRWKGFEMMFHVSTLLPYLPGEQQQMHRKRRIGNDIGVVIFQEGGFYTPPIVSQFLHAYYVVSPHKNGYRFGVSTTDGVPEFGPAIPDPAVFDANGDFLDLLFTKVLNGLLSSLRHPALREKIWCKPKEAYLCNIVLKHTKGKSVSKGLVAPDSFT